MRKISTLLIFSAVTLCSYSQVRLDTGLVACYPFSGNANDVTGNGNNGTVNGATLTTDRFSTPNSAYLFTSTSSTSIDLNSDFDLQRRTINLWFYANSITSTSKVIYDSDHPNLQHGESKMRVLDNNGPKLRMSISDNSTILDYSVVSNQWQMATITVDPTNITYYLDGVQIGQVPYVWAAGDPVGNSTAVVGASRLFDRFFDGKIDDISIYNRALTAQEVYALYDDGIYCYPVGINENSLSDNLELNIFPNPASNYLNVSLNSNIQRLSIYNSIGQVVLNQVNINESFLNINVDSFSKGIYVVEVLDEKGNLKSKKLIVE